MPALDSQQSGKRRGDPHLERESIDHSLKRRKSDTNNIMNYLRPNTQPRPGSSNKVPCSDQVTKSKKLNDSCLVDPDRNVTTRDSHACFKISEPQTRLLVSESIGDIFDAPQNAVLIHACNCEGSWGAGIATAFKKHYLGAFKLYAAHCKNHRHDLLGTALLIPPEKLDSGKTHFIGCLFTSRSKGKKRDSPSTILKATTSAMADLWKQIQAWKAEHSEPDAIVEIRMCKINSGLFAVPWEKTKEAIEKTESGDTTLRRVEVISRECDET